VVHRTASRQLVRRPIEVAVDNDEILVVGELGRPELSADADAAAVAAAESARIKRYREDTRDHRMQVADEAQHRYRRKVSWGARCGGTTELFTVASVPVMTRLRMDERTVLDTLIAAGWPAPAARRWAWCVKLVVRTREQWIAELRQAFEQVERRGKGPLKGAKRSLRPGRFWSRMWRGGPPGTLCRKSA
jgi:hypothetical protein